MAAPDTVTDAIRLLKADGYDTELQLVDGAICWAQGTGSCSPHEMAVERLFRFEGPSDPGDEMVVFGLFDPVSGTKGVLASAYGPAADPEVLDHLVGLQQRYRPGDPKP